MMKRYAVAAVAFGMSATALVGCSSPKESQHDKCKAAAEHVFQQVADARNLGDLMDLSAKYNSDSDRLRDTLPECKPLSNSEDDQIQKELKPLIDKATTHATELLVRDGLTVEGN